MHVKEAYRLLNKSIIRVDQPDVDLKEDEGVIMTHWFPRMRTNPWRPRSRHRSRARNNSS